MAQTGISGPYSRGFPVQTPQCSCCLISASLCTFLGETAHAPGSDPACALLFQLLPGVPNPAGTSTCFFCCLNIIKDEYSRGICFPLFSRLCSAHTQCLNDVGECGWKGERKRRRERGRGHIWCFEELGLKLGASSSQLFMEKLMEEPLDWPHRGDLWHFGNHVFHLSVTFVYSHLCT